ncbi:alpha/beta fold hydrolase [Paractinoplanes brasiliensis]|uniref:Pimeloyl-ACP methyl ester carboxylesterase n=1 Tax=Paractinoplanes brasiliensis TaxID=52695 RepID=A0A4R6JDE4_9ACTN|nr:alpha/beta hydrolase [Actinoplanes brasiliensis]TDO32546.1 pimeloyl-ACP methyl ester carboxylesterase [Actinoplanes brasiliensis]GID27578.1 alpha/beta hydrolase [Actinoplanes brasiliensis]
MGEPTIVLVHGAFAESAGWNGVIADLLGDGFRVIAVANPLRGLASDSDYLRAVLAGIDGEIICVGHSYGGCVISNGATGNAAVRALVFVGGFAPDAGESATKLAGRYEGGTLGETLLPVKLPDGNTDLYIRQDLYHVQFAADSPAAEAAIMAVGQRPIVESALNEASGDPAWRTVPSWFLFGTEDKNIPAEVHRFMAQRAGSRRTVELPGGSHSVGIPEASTVAGLIREAASAIG